MATCRMIVRIEQATHGLSHAVTQLVLFGTSSPRDAPKNPRYVHSLLRALQSLTQLTQLALEAASSSTAGR